MPKFEQTGTMYMGDKQKKQSEERKITYEKGAMDARETIANRDIKKLEQGKGYEDCEIINGTRMWVVWTEGGYEMAWRKEEQGDLCIDRISANSRYARKIFNEVLSVLEENPDLSSIQIGGEIRRRRDEISKAEWDPKGLLNADGREKESSY